MHTGCGCTSTNVIEYQPTLTRIKKLDLTRTGLTYFSDLDKNLWLLNANKCNELAIQCTTITK